LTVTATRNPNRVVELTEMFVDASGFTELDDTMSTPFGQNTIVVTCGNLVAIIFTGDGSSRRPGSVELRSLTNEGPIGWSVMFGPGTPLEVIEGALDGAESADYFANRD
jgi:hypothetical protein